MPIVGGFQGLEERFVEGAPAEQRSCGGFSAFVCGVTEWRGCFCWATGFLRGFLGFLRFFVGQLGIRRFCFPKFKTETGGFAGEKGSFEGQELMFQRLGWYTGVSTHAAKCFVALRDSKIKYNEKGFWKA